MLSARVKTPGFASRYNLAADVWSFGIFLEELVLGRAPYAHMKLESVILTTLHEDAPTLNKQKSKHKFSDVRSSHRGIGRCCCGLLQGFYHRFQSIPVDSCLCYDMGFCPAAGAPGHSGAVPAERPLLPSQLLSDAQAQVLQGTAANALLMQPSAQVQDGCLHLAGWMIRTDGLVGCGTTWLCGVSVQKAQDSGYLVRYLLNGTNGTPFKDMLRSVTRTLRSSSNSSVSPKTSAVRDPILPTKWSEQMQDCGRACV
jgi:serine/threonine protein kinase